MRDELPFERMNREIFVRKESETSPKFGQNPNLRPISDLLEYGIINIDKPSGPTSHQVSAYVQQILGLDKSGHSGTLDPKVTGVLPVALGRATRIVQALLIAGKEYVGVMHLHKEHSEKDIDETAKSFIGKIKQLPPIKSAVKREIRFRKIYYFDILDISKQDVLFKIGCQAGTYIRKLVHDFGVKLGSGAHMTELRRTKAGPFREAGASTLHDLTDAYHYLKEDKNEKYIRKIIQPIEAAVSHLPKIWVIDTSVDSICHGAAVALPGISMVESDIQVGELVAVMTLKDEFISLGTARMKSKDMLGEKGIAIKTDKVFMKEGTYPKIPKLKEE